MTLVTGGSAQAHTKAIKDGDDVPGKLDIRQVTATHSGSTITHTIQTFGRWSSRTLRRDNLMLGWFSTDGDDVDAERFLYIFYSRGKLRGVVVNRRGDALFTVKMTRPNTRTVKWRWDGRSITKNGGYFWGGFTYFKASGACSKTCVDVAPNTVPSQFDYTPPVAEILTELPNGLATDIYVDSGEFELEFIASDLGSGGMAKYYVQRRLLGASTWTTVRQAKATTSPSELMEYDLPVSQGNEYQFRVQVRDGSGHTVNSDVLQVMVPYDDRASVFSTSWSEGWTLGGHAGDYMGTLHEALGGTPTFNHTFSGSELWVIGRDPVIVTVDGGEPQTVDLGGARGVFHVELSEGEHTVLLERAGISPTAIDAVAFR